jgi:hypothetical protein
MTIIRRLLSNAKYLSIHSLKSDFGLLQEASNCNFRTQFHGADPWFSAARNSCSGERCFLLGCGPSLNAVDLGKLEGHKVMGVNGTALIDGLNLDYFVTVSNYFWKSHQKDLSDLECRRFIPYFLREFLESNSPTVWLNSIADKEYKILDVEKPWKFSYDPDRFIFLGGTVIFVCLQILYYLGYEEVVVLGLDHDYGIDKNDVPRAGKSVSSDSLKAHFKKDYYRKGEQVHIDLHGMERAYDLAEEAFRANGRRILNATPGTKLETFEKVEYGSLF